VHLWDGGLAEPGDLSAQFCLGAGDLGQPRAGASAAALQQLNSAVEVKVLGGALLDNDLSGYGVVVLCGALLSESLAISDHLRALPGGGPSLVRGESRGVFGSVFCDFGASHTVTDPDGEEPHLAILSSVGSQENVLVTCVEDERIQFQEGDLVELREVRA
jgi:ubiquitin-activating enzyme E1